MSKEYLLYLTNQRTEAEKKAFLAGCRAMLTAFRGAPTDQYPQLYSSMTETHILSTLIKTDQCVTDQRASEISIIMNTCDYDKLKARAFIFNVARIDDLGRELDQHGNPIESTNYVQLPNTTHRPYPDQQIQHYLTGQSINQADYDRLPTKFQSEYEFVRSLELTLHGRPILTVTSNDYSLVCQLIRNDILIGGCPVRYLLAIADGGILENYRSVVLSAFSELGDESNFTPMLISHIDCGLITTPGHLLIARIQSILRNTTATAFLRYSTEPDLSTWCSIIQICEEDQDLSHFITDKDFETYTDNNFEPLPGAILKNGQWSIATLIDKTNKSARKDYFKHILIPKFSNKLIALLNTTLKCEDIYSLRPDTLNALAKLAKCLIKYHPGTDTDFIRKAVAAYGLC